MRARARSIDGPAPSFDPNEVVSEVVQLLLDSRLSAFESAETIKRRGTQAIY
jgi:hypothetical protein